jgi:hypothetical protein
MSNFICIVFQIACGQGFIAVLSCEMLFTNWAFCI